MSERARRASERKPAGIEAEMRKRKNGQLKKARDEVGRRGREMQTIRAQNVTWSTDNKQRREMVERIKGEAEELRAFWQQILGEGAHTLVPATTPAAL